MSESFRPSDAFGIQRSLKPVGVLPQQADVIDAALPIAEDELLIEVESLNIDSASFRQISETCGGDVTLIERHILDLVSWRGKHHNPVTGSGGMLIGRVSQVGPAFPIADKPVEVGDRIATLVSSRLRLFISESSRWFIRPVNGSISRGMRFSSRPVFSRVCRPIFRKMCRSPLWMSPGRPPDPQTR